MAKAFKFLLVVMIMVIAAGCGDKQPVSGAATADGSTNATPAGIGTPQPTSGLDEIRKRGTIKVGVKYDLPLFGYLDPETNQVQGFDVDMARALADDIFGNPNAVEFTEAVVQNRVTYLNAGVVDVVFATMITNEERAQQVDFSDCYFVAGQTLLVPVGSPITSVNDLVDKQVSTVTGSASEAAIRKLVPDVKLQLFATDADAFEALQAGLVDATTSTDVVLFGFQKKTPGKYKMVGDRIAPVAYAAGIRKGNESLLNEVNKVIRNQKQTGKWAELYRKWIGLDAPPVPPEDWRTAYSNP